MIPQSCSLVAGPCSCGSQADPMLRGCTLTLQPEHRTLPMLPAEGAAPAHRRRHCHLTCPRFPPHVSAMPAGCTAMDHHTNLLLCMACRDCRMPITFSLPAGSPAADHFSCSASRGAPCTTPQVYPNLSAARAAFATLRRVPRACISLQDVVRVQAGGSHDRQLLLQGPAPA